MITDRVVAPLMPRRDADAAERVACTTLVNLRPEAAGAFGCRLGVVPAPEVYAATAGCTPLCCLVREGRPVLLSARGSDVVFSDVRIPALAPSVFRSKLPGKALCAVRRSDTEALVMTSAGPVRLTVEGGQVDVASLACDFPAVTLLAEDVAAQVTATVQARTLSREYAGAETLDERDADTLSADLLDAYRRICVKAAGAGRLVQPVLARYRLTDRDGRTLFTSAPVLLAHSTGVQCDGGTDVYSDDRRTMRGYTLAAWAWTPAVLFHGASGPRAAEVAACEVYMTPMMHPFVPGAKASYTTGRATSASQPFVRVSLPGREGVVSNGTLGATHRIVMGALARLDKLESRVAVINNPFRASAHKVQLDITPSDDPVGEATAMRAALRVPAPMCSRRDALLRLPHTFVAGCTAADAGTRAWGDITVKRFAGHSVANFAAAVSDEAWQAVTVVRFGDGKGVVLRESHITGAPTALVPVLSYPAPYAESIEVAVSAGGRTLCGKYTLATAENGRLSAFVADSVCRLTLAEGVAAEPQVSESADRFEGAVAVADDADPFSVAVVAEPGLGTVVALEARRSAETSWEFGRCRFVAAGTRGIYSIAVASGRRSTSTRRLSERGTPDGAVLCQGEGGVLYALEGGLDIAGPSLCRIDSRGRLEMTALGRAYCGVACDGVRGEVTVCRLDGSADVFCTGRGYGRYMRDGLGVTDIKTIEGEAYGISAAGIVRLHGGVPGAETDVEMEVYVRHAGDAPFVPTALVAGMAASEMDVAVTVEGVSAAGAIAWPVAVFTLRGPCRSPVPLALRCRPVRALRVHLRGTVSADFVFDSLEIKSRPWKHE